MISARNQVQTRGAQTLRRVRWYCYRGLSRGSWSCRRYRRGISCDREALCWTRIFRLACRLIPRVGDVQEDRAKLALVKALLSNQPIVRICPCLRMEKWLGDRTKRLRRVNIKPMKAVGRESVKRLKWTGRKPSVVHADVHKAEYVMYVHKPG